MVNLDKVYSKDKKQLAQKIDKFSKAGKEKIHFVLDFDKTLTINKDTKMDITMFNVVRSHLPEKYKEKTEVLYLKYRPLEIAHIMTTEQALEWWEGTLQIFIDAKLNWGDIRKDFKRKAKIRPGAKKMFDLLNRDGIPSVIFSGGIKDAILLWCSEYEIIPTQILSTKLVLSDDETIIGWDKNSVIHSSNKKEVGHTELLELRNKRPFIIVIGDSMEDAGMVEGDKEVLRIKIHDPRLDEKGKEEIIFKEGLENFDVVLDSKSLSFTHSLINSFN